MSQWTSRAWFVTLVSVSLAWTSVTNAQTVGPKPEELAKAREHGINYLKKLANTLGNLGKLGIIQNIASVNLQPSQVFLASSRQNF